MSDMDFGTKGAPSGPIAQTGDSRLVAQRIGTATVYFRVDDEPLPLEGETEVRAVALINADVFNQAARIVGEGITAISDRVNDLLERVRPTELQMEISFSFEATGRTTIVPVLLTGDTSAKAGLKVTAVWKPTRDA